MGTRKWVISDIISATISPNHITGRASRQGENPVACIPTSSLSDDSRLVT